MEMALSLPGISLFFSIICGLSFIVTYFILPETENISLEDIERHFSNNSKKITDRNIVKSIKNKNVIDVECSLKKTERPFKDEANNDYGIDNKCLEID